MTDSIGGCWSLASWSPWVPRGRDLPTSHYQAGTPVVALRFSGIDVMDIDTRFAAF